MNNVKVVGIDLAKTVFFVHGVDRAGKAIVKKKLSRSKVLEFFANLTPCLVGMEAGGGSNYWAREIKKLGHEVRLMAPQFVKPYVKTDKTDSNDAEAICEAVTRPTMRFVPTKSIDQQDLQSIHRIRERLVSARTSLACEIRGFLGEYGIVIPVGRRKLVKELPTILADENNQLTSLTRDLIRGLEKELEELTEKIDGYNERIQLVHKNHPVSQRLTEIPGVGILAATAIVSSISNPQLFKNGREFSAYLGLVPKQKSSGGKQVMLGITKRGDKYIRKMLVHGARAYLAHGEYHKRTNDSRYEWVSKVKERRGHNKAAVAFANKNARVIWAMMSKGESFRVAA